MQMPRPLVLLVGPVLLAALAALAGCPGNNASAVDAAAPPATSATASSAPTASASTAAPSGSGDSGGGDDAGGPVDSGAAIDAALAKADAATTMACGTKPLPDCPMQAWMKANTSAAMQKKDFPALAAALDQVAKMQPPGYAGWVPFATDGAKAARAQDVDAVKASCKGCHGQFQKKFQADATLRPRKI